jgi:hypothetical protein
MNKIFAFILLLLSTSVLASTWQQSITTDAITDKESIEAFVMSSTGDRFTILRRTDGKFWGYFQLAPPHQFRVGERLIARIDKNAPREFNEDLQKLTKRLGDPANSWEWNPSLVGFLLWHGDQAEGCGWLTQLYNGKKLVIRYHPNQSTFRDVVFKLSGNQKAISKAAGFNLSKCQEKT